MKKIYAKMVRERRSPFQIETSIVEEAGKRYVIKKPLVPEAKEHVEQMEKTFKESAYAELLCPCFVRDGAVFFTFVKGKSLAEKMLEALDAKNKVLMCMLVEEYEQIIQKQYKEKERELVGQDAKYKEVFGEIADLEEFGYRNLIFDLTFDNIVYAEKTPYIIDYEWIFSFPISINFIKFRAVYAFMMKYGKQIQSVYSSEEFYALFHLSLEDKEKYQKYNRKFIAYVYGENSYEKILEKYRKKCFDVTHMMEDRVSIQKFSDHFYKSIVDIIKEHGYLYDDYEKFFRVTEKIRKSGEEKYLFSEEFYKEFMIFLEGNFDMIEFYKKQSKVGTKEKIKRVLKK